MNKLKSIIIGIIAAIILFPIDIKADEMPETTEDKIDVVNLVENSDNNNNIGAIVQLKADMKMLSYNELKDLLEDFISKGFENNILIGYIEDEIVNRESIIEKETTEEIRILNGSPNTKEIVKIINKYDKQDRLDSRQEKAYKLAVEALDNLDKKDNLTLLIIYLLIPIIIVLFGILIIDTYYINLF